MIKYMGEVSFLCSKNNLEKAIHNFIKKYDRKIILASHIEVAKKAIIMQVDILSDAFPRCTPVKVNFWTPARDANDKFKDWVLSGCDSVRLVFRCGEETE